MNSANFNFGGWWLNSKTIAKHKNQNYANLTFIYEINIRDKNVKWNILDGRNFGWAIKYTRIVVECLNNCDHGKCFGKLGQHNLFLNGTWSTWLDDWIFSLTTPFTKFLDNKQFDTNSHVTKRQRFAEIDKIRNRSFCFNHDDS